MSYPYAVTLGRVGGQTRVAAIGHIPSAAAGADVWEGGGAYPLLASAQTLELVSASANDALGGTGARSFLVSGLDVNFNLISETVQTNGTTPVSTVNSFMRVNSMQINGAGSGLTNAGDMTLRVQGGGTTQAIARAGFGFAKQCVYTVPAGFTLLMAEFNFDVSGGGTVSNVTFGVLRTVPGSNGYQWIQNEFAAGALSPTQRTLATGAVVQATNTISMRITNVMGAVGAYAVMIGFLIPNLQLQ